MASYEIDIDPRELRLPGSLPGGAVSWKLQRQIAQFGSSTVGMPLPWVYETTDGKFLIYNGVTRATRIATLLPRQAIRVLVIGKLNVMSTLYQKIGDTIP